MVEVLDDTHPLTKGERESMPVEVWSTEAESEAVPPWGKDTVKDAVVLPSLDNEEEGHRVGKGVEVGGVDKLGAAPVGDALPPPPPESVPV